ncbi:MAG TPA: TIGR01777 family oxidoreductase [Terracidiphilus sp.]
MQSRILFSGASGMLGTALRHSLASEFETLQLVRRQPLSPSELTWNPDSARPFAQTNEFEGLTAAIHLSGANLAGKRWTAAYKRELVESRVASTRALAQALAELSRPPQVLLVASGTGIYGNRGDEILDESSAPGTGFLADLCRAWEEAAQPAVQAGIRVVHLRCGPVLGGGGGALGKMLPIFRLGLGGPLGNGRQWMSWIALADLIAAVRFLIADNQLTGPINMVAPEPVTNAEFTRALGRVLHRPAILPAPAFALRLALGDMADDALLASARAVPKRLLDSGFQFRYPSIDEALREALA